MPCAKCQILDVKSEKSKVKSQILESIWPKRHKRNLANSFNSTFYEGFEGWDILRIKGNVCCISPRWYVYIFICRCLHFFYMLHFFIYHISYINIIYHISIFLHSYVYICSYNPAILVIVVLSERKETTFLLEKIKVDDGIFSGLNVKRRFSDYRFWNEAMNFI